MSVLITGGTKGIGLGLARRFLARGEKVLVTGKAEATLPGLLTLVNDIAEPEQRVQLAQFVKENLPDVTWVINNAGIQRRVALADDMAPWNERQREIDILLAAPIHLNTLLVPLLLANEKPTTIVNVTSGGAYVPQVFAPVYSACKAALHSYTVTLRHALANTKCRVVELAPPAVQTALATPAHGAPLDAFCDAVFDELTQSDAAYIGYGPTANIKSDDQLFVQSAARAAVRQY